jgi:curli production assembly/transport component CsgE
LNSKVLGTIISIFIIAIGFNEAWGQDSTLNKSDSLKNSINAVDSVQTKKNTELQQFKEAFEKVIEQQKIKQKKKVKKDPTLDLGVLVFDKTRSRMGREFYNLFYQGWKAPKDADNATITIFEKPTPGLGSLVTIKIDYEKVFRARLQPRRQYIKALSQNAIARCRRIIQKNAKVRKQLTGY